MLKELIISNCNEWFTGECLLHFNNLKNLDIKYSNVQDIYLNNLFQLKRLNIKNCININGECLLSLKNLTELDISSTSIKDEYLQNLKKLKVLHAIECNDLNGNCLLQLKRLKTIYFEHSFSSYGCDISFNLSVKEIRNLIERGKTLSDISNKKYEESSFSIFD
ncbi:hypothetical protein ABK040_009486 [Willaertia magna]